MSDGSIVFDTKIDGTNIDKEMAAISKKVDSIGSKISQNAKKTSLLVAQEIDRAAKELAQLDKQIASQGAKRRPDNEYIKQLREQAWEIRSYMENLQSHGAEALEHSTSSEVVEKYRQLKQELQQSAQAMANLKREQIDLQRSLTQSASNAAGGGGLKERFISLFNTAKAGIGNALTGAFQSLGRNITGATQNLRNFASQSAQTGISAGSLAKSIFSLGNIFGAMVKRKLISTIFQSVSKGLEALQNSSYSAGAGLRSLEASGTSAGYSIAAAIAPLASMIVPVFNTITNAIMTAMNALARFFALLGGKSTYTKAVKQNAAVAGAAGGVAKKAKEAAQAVKEEEKALASFDEINQLNLKNQEETVTPDVDTGGGGGGGAGSGYGFVEEAIKPTEFMTELAERLKAIWADILGIVHALAEAWQEAWEYNGNGEAIMNALKQILWDILDMIKEITGATLLWAEALDLRPLVTGIRDVLESLEPLIDRICDAIAYIWINALLPLAKWLTENAVPVFLEGVASALDLICTVLDYLSPAATELYETILQPLIGEIGEAVIEILTWLKEKLDEINLWMVDNQPIMETIMHLIEAIAAVISIVFTGAILIAIQMIKAFGESIGAVIRGAIQLFQGLIDFVAGVFTGNWERAWNGVKEIFRSIFNTIASICENIINGIVNALNSLSFDIPEWVPMFGGNHFGFSLSHISIPRLATGTVIPPSAGEFAAILGDNNSDTEVVSPLETMKAAFLEALEESGAGGGQNIVIRFDGTMGELVRMLKPELDSENRRVGVKLVTE
ncbi:MAG: hypothetical protein IKE28_11870 [Solobacterium sp.]|nr:hypothetical protein [Solobacterium sp.]